MRRLGFVVAFALVAGCGGRARRTAPIPAVGFTPKFAFRVDVAEIDAVPLDSALARKDWRRALDRIERMLKQDGFVAVPRPQVEYGPQTAYVHPSKYLIRRLADADREFLAAYRERHDHDAHRAAEREDFSVEAWERFFFCTGMDVAGDRLAGALLERGRAVAALEIWTALLRFYPAGGAIPKTLMEARAMAAAAAAGDGPALESLPIRADARVLAGDRTIDLETLRGELRRRLRRPELAVARSGSTAPLPRGWNMTCLWWAGEWRVVLHNDEREWVVLRGAAPPVAGFSSRIGLVCVMAEDRVLWSSAGGLAGVAELEPPRLVWMGPLEEAPVPRLWHHAALVAQPSR